MVIRKAIRSAIRPADRRVTDRVSIPGIGGSINPVQQIERLLFSAGETGEMWVPILDRSLHFQDLAGTTTAAILASDPVGCSRGLYAAISAAASATGRRPLLARHPRSGIRNRLLWSDDLTNAIWTNTLASNPAADQIAMTASNSALTNQEFALIATGTVTFSVWLRADAPVTLRLRGRNNGANLALLFGTANVTTTWTRFSGTAIPTGTGIDRAGVQNSTDAAARTVYARGFQVESGSTATNQQQVTVASNITQEGESDVWYWRFDGTDDCLLTPDIDFSSGDKMSVIVVARARTDHAGVVTELSANHTLNDGSFVVLRDTDKWEQNSKGDEGFNGYKSVVRESRFIDILISTYDFSAVTRDGENPISTVNGISDKDSESGTFTNNTGNFGEFPLYIGARADASSRFNGGVYAVIVTSKVITEQDVETLVQIFENLYDETA